ncbi:response regulator receiver domain protein [Sphingobacterium spiritivorum ATCC 33300]|uniref:histidine kinase n=1 Tax=Sphingobacterium spiritivorum ATCC 33300 TaxID=525372 RepID=C2FZB1_SPHSI|nr:response regulator [Sphingobacterium spiritivorum]EEI91720.1 response regulator receiver domain protein [Sphingobacterium spiritivorum ATCC 33300]QQS97100.1 response regulator [Sphingobacterium spiritivorum]
MKKLNLLILDDKIENIISLKALLEDIEGLNILSSSDPNEALRLCWKEDIAIALIDVQMPEINGFEFVSILKSNPKTREIIAIMVTAISKEDKYLIQGLNSGAVDYLYKPLSPEITIAKVKSFMQQVLTQLQIKEKNAELEQSKLELIRSKEEAEQARKSKEIFLANMSHEIRTPINGIMGITQMLRSSTLSSEQKDWVNRLDSASHSLLLIINDILDISKIDSGMMKLEFENLVFQDLFDDLNKIFKIKAANKNLEFEMNIDSDLPTYVKTDSLRLQQILSNFISNGLKFTEKGKVTLSIRILEVKDNSYFIRFSVKDTGIGIRAESLNKIFLAFEQADDGITKKFGGTGLGLAIVKRLADLFNGSVDATSVYNEGSEFSFQCWFEKAESYDVTDSKIEQLYTQLPKFERLIVLIAEDNDLNSFMLSHILKSWDCEVDIVKNGKSALENVENKNYDLIMMDTHMPIMSGFEAIKEIKNHADPVKANTPIITISASVLESEQAEAYEVGADGVIGKPFDAIDLYNRIIEVIEKKKQIKLGFKN